MSANGVEQAYYKIGWCPREMIDLRLFKEPLILCKMHLIYLKQILNNWATQNKIIPQYFKGLVNHTRSCSPIAMDNMIEKRGHKY